MTGLVAGKVALITGAGSGMGRATAELFADEGAAVGVLDIAEEAGWAVVDTITAAGGRATYLPADVTDQNSVARAIADLVDTFGRLDIAVNNAAVAPDAAPLHEFDEQVFRQILEVDLIGVAICLKHELRQLLAQGTGGAIVNIGSTRSRRARGLAPGYSAAKYAVVGLTEAAAQQYGPQQIRVNAVLPGVVQTPMTAARRANSTETDAAYLNRVGGVLQRIGDPAEIAQTTLWVCSDRASYVTGQSLAADGGYLIR